MMEDVLYFTHLYDIYKSLLTIKQRQIFEDYFFENLTLEEIAENGGVTKSYIAKSIKQIKNSLIDFEEKLHFVEYMDSLKKEFGDEQDILNRLSKYDMIVL